MSDKMYEMFCMDGFNHRKKMNNKIMWEEMGSDETRAQWYVVSKEEFHRKKQNENENKEKMIWKLPKKDGDVDPDAIRGTLYENLLERVSKITTLEKNQQGEPEGPMRYTKKQSPPDGHNVEKTVYFNSESVADGPIKVMLVDFYRTPMNLEKGILGGSRLYTKNVEFSPLDENGRGTIKYNLSQECGESTFMKMNERDLTEFLDDMGIALDGPINPESIKGEIAYKMR